MNAAKGFDIGLIGALAAFPRRLAARHVEASGGRLGRGTTRRTTHVVLGRQLLARKGASGIEARLDELSAGSRVVLSENGFLRLLGLAVAPEHSAITRASLAEQSGLGARDLRMLLLFDAFEHDSEPFSFRDLILARKYAGLITGGAGWDSIARSVHRSGSVASLTALSLRVAGNDAIHASHREGTSELDGQFLLGIDGAEGLDADAIFAEAEEAEDEGRIEEAAALYGKCLSLDPRDSVAAFNRGNCLRAAGHVPEARTAYIQALKLDPRLVEAWFNLAGLLQEAGEIDAARRHFSTAIDLDENYADAVFNLARLEYDAGRLVEARHWWQRYLRLDDSSGWARIARRGVQVVDLATAHKSAG